MSTNPTPPTPSTGGGRAAFDNFITSVRRIGIWRTDDRWIGGVAAGIAHRLKVDPLLIRGAFVVTAILGGVGFLIYGLAWMLLPEAANGRIHLQEVSYGRVNAGFIGSAIATAIGVVGTFPFIGVTGGWGFVVVVLALVVVGLLVLPELARSPQTQGPGAPLGAQPQGPIPAGPNAGGPVGASTQANGPGATPWPGGTSPQANGPVAGPSPVGASTQANSPGAGPSPVGASTQANGPGAGPSPVGASTQANGPVAGPWPEANTPAQAAPVVGGTPVSADGGPDLAATAPASLTAGNETMGNNTAAEENAENETAADETTPNQATGNQTAWNGAAPNPNAWNETEGNQTTPNQTAWNEPQGGYGIGAQDPSQGAQPTVPLPPVVGPPQGTWSGMPGPGAAGGQPLAPPLATAAPPTYGAPKRRPPGGVVWAVIWAAALFLIATVMLLDRWYSATNHASFYAPGLAIGGVIALLGIAIVGLGMAGRRVGGITACAIIAMVVGLPAMATVYAAWNVHVGPNIGTAQWRPTGTALRDTYDVGIGAGELDLRNIAVGDKPQEVNVDIGIGRGKLILPRSVPIQVTAMVDVGDILIELPEGWTMDSGNGAARSMGWDTAVGGIDQEITAWSPEVEDGAEPLLRVKVNLSIGHLEIEQGEPS